MMFSLAEIISKLIPKYPSSSTQILQLCFFLLIWMLKINYCICSYVHISYIYMRLSN